MLLLQHARLKHAIVRMILSASNRCTVVIIASIVFLSLCFGLAYSHLDQWAPLRAQHARPNPEPNGSFNENLRETYLKTLYQPSIKPDDEGYKPWGAFEWKLSENPSWTKSLGKDFCIIDLDNRKFDEPGQIFNERMTWDNATEVHGLSAGLMNHWLYAKIHGYKYYYIRIDEYDDRRTSWKKPEVLSKILKEHDACIYIDSDAIFHHLDLPFEWLMNYWSIHPSTNSLALALDPQLDHNLDKYGKVYLNTGFIVAQNNPQTFEIMNAWSRCADDDSPHPGCVEFRTNMPGSVTDQGGFGTYVRYEFAADIKELPCNEANGYPESETECGGTFIKHLWTGKDDWIKVVVGQQLPGELLEVFHEKFLEEKESFYLTEGDLMNGRWRKPGDEMERDSSP